MPRATPYSQSQLLLPLLGALEGSPRGLPAREACDAVAESIGLSAEDRQAAVVIGGGRFNAFDRDVRWVRQKAVNLGMVEVPTRGQWVLSGKGRNALRVAKPGIVVTVYVAGDGKVLWGAIEDAVAQIEDRSVSLIMTSPPYPQLREKQYGNLDSRRHVEWLTQITQMLLPKLTENGSLVWNLGDTYQKNQPTIDPYCERFLLRLVDDLGLHLAGRFEWNNPSKMPAPAEWCTVRRVRVKASLERCYWMSPSTNPKADNRRVLQPYSASMQRLLNKGGERRALRPSGHAFSTGAFSVDHGGSIPGNLITAANTESNGRYMRHCREQGLPIHPARFPSALPEFFIKMLTDEGDLVADVFAGSCKTAEVARGLNRRFLCVDRVLDYLLGGVGGRLAHA